jgi:hypothetical protein
MNECKLHLAGPNCQNVFEPLGVSNTNAARSHLDRHYRWFYREGVRNG